MARRTKSTSFSLAPDVYKKVKDLPSGVRSEMVNDFFRKANIEITEVKQVVTHRLVINGKDYGEVQGKVAAPVSKAVKTVLRKRGRPSKADLAARAAALHH